MMVRPTRSVFASATSPATSSAATLTLRTRGSVAVPPLPGATSTSETFGDCAHFHASACSRPPEPTIRIFIGGLCLVAEVAHAREHHGHAVFVGRGNDFIVTFAASGLHD